MQTTKMTSPAVAPNTTNVGTEQAAAPRWPPFAEYEDGEVEKELQAHGTRLLEMVCDDHYYDAATRAQLLTNLPAWVNDIESLKQSYTRTIELRALEYPKRDQEAFIASHRPVGRIPCIQVHVERETGGDRVFNIGYGFRYSNFPYQTHETFGCCALRVCLYDDGRSVYQTP